MKHILFIVTLLIAHYTLSIAQWSGDPTVNNAISTAADDQLSPTIVSDGAGGAIMTWEDRRSGAANADIYAQRIDASGTVQWTADGVAISTAADYQSSPTIVSDGAGGAIITWQDYRSGTNHDIYAQRINASGVVQWDTNGVAISTAANVQSSPTIVSDGASGAIITWYDLRNGNYDIYAQRINASGVVQWATNGDSICTAAGDQYSHTVVSDGAGGAVIAWYDSRPASTSPDIYAQRISASGVVQWIANGVLVCGATNSQGGPQSVNDGSGGAIITWYDFRSNTDADIYAAKIDSNGNTPWTADGVPISVSPYNQFYPVLVSDGAGGAIVTWQDSRNNPCCRDIYAQRVNSNGDTLWAANGIVISAQAGEQIIPSIAGDGAGGAIIAFEDARTGPRNIYAQRVDGSGVVQWTPGGVPICTAANDQYAPRFISDGANGAIVAWYDYRGVTTADIYASRVFSDGALPIQLASFSATTVNVNVKLDWTTISETNNYGFYVERRLQSTGTFTTVSDLIPGAGTSLEEHNYSWTDKNVSPTTYIYRLRQMDLNGDVSYSHEITVSGVSGVAEEVAPRKFQLFQSYPNPFNPTTAIKFTVERTEHAVLKIYNMLGQEVAKLFDGIAQSGKYYSIQFDGSTLSSGMYVYRVVTESHTENKKMLLLR